MITQSLRQTNKYNYDIQSHGRYILTFKQRNSNGRGTILSLHGVKVLKRLENKKKGIVKEIRFLGEKKNSNSNYWREINRSDRYRRQHIIISGFYLPVQAIDN